MDTFGQECEGWSQDERQEEKNIDFLPSFIKTCPPIGREGGRS